MLLLLPALATMCTAKPTDSIKLVRSEFIYESAPFPSCHAATIEQTSSGKIVAAWFGGTAESNPDVGIYSSELGRSGWTNPRRVAAGSSLEGERRPCYNPVLFQPSSGPILLFYKVGTGPQTWWGMMTRSYDDGASWENPIRLPEGIFGPIKNRPIELEDGTMLCPSSTEDQGWRVHFEFTRDLGRTWSKTEALNDGKAVGAIQPSILKLADGGLRAIGRTQQGKMFSIDSPDNGESWGRMTMTEIPNPNSGCDAITLDNGQSLLVYNNTTIGRSSLTVAISKDAGSWQPVLVLENEPGEYSYPSLIQARDGLVHIVYTWQRKRIKHAVLQVK